MSGRGPNDDDIRDLIEEMRQTNQNLERLVDSMTRAARGQGEEDEEEGTTENIDKWDVGNAPAGKASTPEQYIQLRRRSANSDSLNAPRADVRKIDNLAEFYLEVFIMYGEHLQKISNSLNNDQWQEFVQLLAIEHGAEEELVEILDPSPATLGVRLVRRDVQLLLGRSHMYFTEAYGNYWFSQSESAFAKKYSSIEDALQLIQDPNEDVLFPNLSPREMNKILAEAIADRRDLTLPNEYIPYLD